MHTTKSCKNLYNMDNIHVNLENNTHRKPTLTKNIFSIAVLRRLSQIRVIYLDMLEHIQEKGHTIALFVERLIM